MSSPRVVICEPVGALREGLAEVLVARGYLTSSMPLHEAVGTDPDLVVAYVRRSTLQECVALVDAGVLVLALYDDDSELPQRAIVGSGVAGVLRRGASAAQIACALDAVRIGLRVVPAEDCESAIRSRLERFAAMTADDLLPIALASRGQTLTEIGEHAGKSSRTVQRQLSGVYQRLGVSNLAGALVLLTALGVLDPF